MSGIKIPRRNKYSGKTVPDLPSERKESATVAAFVSYIPLLHFLGCPVQVNSLLFVKDSAAECH